MKNKFILFLLLLIFTSCKHVNYKYPAPITLAEIFMDTNPDSSLFLIKFFAKYNQPRAERNTNILSIAKNKSSL